jgi:KDO2-lipid IV(A) lauroyltransferase
VSEVPLGKRLRRGARSLLLRGLIRLFAAMPTGVAMAVGTLAARLAWPLARETRRRMLAHLEVAFPERSPAEREAIARDCLLHLAWLVAEVVTVRRLHARLAEYVSFAPGAEERLRAALARGRGIVYATGHVGNWELMARRVASGGIPSATIAKASGDPRITALLEEIRAEGGFETLWREDPATARAMIRCFKQGKLLGLLIDQDTRVQGVFVPFFGKPAYTPRAAGDLAMRFRAPVVVGWCRRRGPRRGDGHEIQVVDVPYDPEAADAGAEALRITAACTAQIERAIRLNPPEWVWMHERWKRQPLPQGATGQAAPGAPAGPGDASKLGA